MALQTGMQIGEDGVHRQMPRREVRVPPKYRENKRDTYCDTLFVDGRWCNVFRLDRQTWIWVDSLQKEFAGSTVEEAMEAMRAGRQVPRSRTTAKAGASELPAPGSTITWSSYNTRKTGIVVAVVPAGELPPAARWTKEGYVVRFDARRPRKTDSVILMISGPKGSRHLFRPYLSSIVRDTEERV
jgi:hypothetical protein